MLAKNLSNKNLTKLLINATSIRTTVHPTAAKVEFITGKSPVGTPVEFKPKRVELEKGKSYSYCACGQSKKEGGIFCDGSHKKVNATLKEGEDKFMPLRFVCEESRSVLLCNCKSSSNRPFCDGTHKTLKPKENSI